MAYGEFTYTIKGSSVTAQWRRQSGHERAHLYPVFSLSQMLADPRLREKLKPLCGARTDYSRTGWCPSDISDGRTATTFDQSTYSACYKCRREAGLLPAKGGL